MLLEQKPRPASPGCPRYRTPTRHAKALLTMAKKAAKKSTRRVSPVVEPVAARVEEQQRKHTINDIARLANVSKKTVSRVINESPFVREETRTRIAGIMERVGYTPDPQARGLAFRRSFLIGLVYDNPNAPYVVNIQEGALGALRRMGYELVVHPCDRNAEKFLPEIRELIGRQKLDGVILLPPVSENKALAEMLRRLECPYVRVVAAPLDEPDNLVCRWTVSPQRKWQSIWRNSGHTRISMIMGPQTFTSAIERLAGFSDALAERGLKLRPEFVVEGRVHIRIRGGLCRIAVVAFSKTDRDLCGQ